MTVRQRYGYWYVGGMVFWAAVFYWLGHRVFGWRLRPLGIAYTIFVGVLSATQIAMYLSERIVDYRARLRRRGLVTGTTWLVLGVGVLAWLVSQHLMSWRVALFFLAVGCLLGLVSLWLGYRLALRWRPDPRA